MMNQDRPTAIISSVRLPKPGEVISFVSALGGLFILAYTFVHTSNVLARYVHPWWVGWIAGAGIELIIFSMSWKLATIKGKETRLSYGRHASDGLLKFTLIISLVVSTIANVAEGYFVSHQTQLTWANILEIDPIQALVGLSSNLLLPILVFAVSELVGSDVEKIAKQVPVKVGKTKRAEDEQPQTETESGRTVERTAASDTPNSPKRIIYAKLLAGEHLGPRPMAEFVGCSPATAKKWIDNYQAEHANGNGKH